MPWFKVDDQLFAHQKWVGAPLRARGLWVTAGSWAASQPDDGFVPTHMLSMFGANKKDAAELVRRGLWHEEEGGWRFHDWLDHQPSKGEVEERRRKEREKKRRQRSRGMETRDDQGQFAGPAHVPQGQDRDSNGTPEGSPTVALPDPTRPVSETSPSALALVRAQGPAEGGRP